MGRGPQRWVRGVRAWRGGREHEHRDCRKEDANRRKIPFEHKPSLTAPPDSPGNQAIESEVSSEPCVCVRQRETASAINPPTSSVPWPPASTPLIVPFRRPARIASSTDRAASASPIWARSRPSAPIAATGLATPLPAYFGALPWIGSKTETLP